MDSMKCMITYANPYRFTDEKTGQEKTGLTVEYLMTDNLNPVINDDGSKGCRHCKESLPLEAASKITEVPGWYGLKFALKPGSKGKPVMKLDDIDFMASIYKKA